VIAMRAETRGVLCVITKEEIRASQAMPRAIPITEHLTTSIFQIAPLHATTRFLVVVFASSQVSDDVVEQIPVSHPVGDSKRILSFFDNVRSLALRFAGSSGSDSQTQNWHSLDLRLRNSCLTSLSEGRFFGQE